MSKLCFLLTAVCATLALGASSASAAPSRSIAPSSATVRVATFQLERPRPVAAVVRTGRHRVSVGSRKLRRAVRRGTLRVRVPRGARARRARLLVRMSARRIKPRKNDTTTDTGTTDGTDSTSGTTDSTSGTTDTTVPVPAPTGTASVLGCGWGTFKVGSWPTDCWRPYSDSSPFNQRVPAGAKLVPNSSAIVSRLMGFGEVQHLNAGGSQDYEHPTYYSQPTDPLFTLHCSESWGTCEIEGMQIRIPDAARAASGRDGHMTIVDQATGWEYDLFRVTSKPAGGGVLTTTWGGRTRIDGDGLDSNATAAMFGNLAGIIRAQELIAGRIDHALFMVVECDSGQHVWPAGKAGRSCERLGLPTTDAPAMGQRFVLDMSEAEIDALNVPAWRKTIFKAMANYGLYVGDTGTGSWGIQFESGATYESFGIENPLKAFGRANNLPTYDGGYVFNVRDGIDWQSKLRVVDPCVAQGTC